MQIQRPLAVVSPTLDADVLTALALAPDVGFTTGQLQRVLPTDARERPRSLPGIREVLTRLVAQGIVSSEHAGRAVIYRLNREHLAAGHVIGLATQRTELLRRMEADIASWGVPPVYAALFGSAARGEMRLDSDIDVFVVWADAEAEGSGESDCSGLADRVAGWTGNDTRMLVRTLDEVAAGWGRDPVLDLIARDALTVWGRSGWLRGLGASAALHS